MDGLLYAKFGVIGLGDGHKELNTKEWAGLQHDLPPTVILYRLKPGTRLRVFHPSIFVLQAFEVRAIIRLIDESAVKPGYPTGERMSTLLKGGLDGRIYIYI